MKSLTAVRKKGPSYPVEFKIKMVELSHRPTISVAQLARKHRINDNLLFKWRHYARARRLSGRMQYIHAFHDISIHETGSLYPLLIII